MIEEVHSGLVRGHLHRGSASEGIVLAHGAGSNANAPLLTGLAGCFADRGWSCLRLSLPFRQKRPTGPPGPGSAAEDRDALAEAAEFLSAAGCKRVFMGGHSYGGRQASMLAAERTDVAAALLLLSYPLHPPRAPATLRTSHFFKLKTPALFVHGSRDPFGSPDEMRSALTLLPAMNALEIIAGAGHELKPVVTAPSSVVDLFGCFVEMKIIG